MPQIKSRPLSEIPRNILERIWLYIEVKGPDECWPWTSSTRNGYGVLQTLHVKPGPRRKRLAHRIAFYLSTGTDPLDLKVCHSCDNPPCCNPRHLFLGTSIDNRMDCVHKKRHNFGETHGRHRLTETDVSAIRKLHESGMSSIKIAAHFCVAHSTIREITRGATWKHLSQCHGTEGSEHLRRE